MRLTETLDTDRTSIVVDVKMMMKRKGEELKENFRSSLDLCLFNIELKNKNTNS